MTNELARGGVVTAELYPQDQRLSEPSIPKFAKTASHIAPENAAPDILCTYKKKKKRKENNHQNTKEYNEKITPNHFTKLSPATWILRTAISTILCAPSKSFRPSISRTAGK